MSQTLPRSDSLRVTLDAVRGDGKSRKIICPAHEDAKASLSVSLGHGGRVLVKCHAGCEFAAIVAAAGLSAADLGPSERTPTQDSSARPRKQIVDTYPYRDEDGRLLYEAVRYQPKDFRQRRPTKDGGYDWKMDGVRRVIYRLPDLVTRLAVDARVDVFICEGEKDVERLWREDLAATTNVGGAGKWRPDYAQQLVKVGATSVVVLPDNDDAGRRHAAQVAESCQAAGLTVQVVTLPDLPAKGDVSDWLDDRSRPRTTDELVTLVADARAQAAAARADAAAASDLATLLDRVQEFIQRFVVLSKEQVVVVALWVAHTHAIAAFDCTGYLRVTSATLRAGKTRLLEVLEFLVPRPWLTGRTSTAALVRKVDAVRPTLLLDETDAAFSGDPEYSEALRGILNTGFRRSGRTTLCVGQGANLTTQEFSTFCPKAIAGIGALPGTVADRAIPVELKRKTGKETVERFCERDVKAEATPLRDALAAWAVNAIDRLRAARPALPAALHDRAQEIVEPLIAIADMAGGDRPKASRDAIVAVMGGQVEDDLRLDLLSDIRDAFGEDVTFISSKDLVEKLVGPDDRPWSTLSKGRPLTGHRLARLLKPFGIVPTQNRERTARGYHADRFEDVWARYLPSKCPERPSGNENGPELAFSEVSSDAPLDTLQNSEIVNKDGPKDSLDTLKAEKADDAATTEADDADPDVF